MNDILSRLRENRPLIHCIVGPVASNFCANGALAIGARPIMAEHPLESAEITASANGLLLNMSGLTDGKMQAMTASAQIAAERSIPMVIDAVGVACSGLRKRFVLKLMDKAPPAVLKGNYSEIYALYDGQYSSSGVDSDKSIDEKSVQKAAVALAKGYKTTVLASGKTDIITDGSRVLKIKNGVAQLGSITATGCLLGTVCACLASAEKPLLAAQYACALLGICGEKAETPKGSGSFMYGLLDALSHISDTDIVENIKMEEDYFEKA